MICPPGSGSVHDTLLDATSLPFKEYVRYRSLLPVMPLGSASNPGDIRTRLLTAGRSPLAARLARAIDVHSQDIDRREASVLAVSGGGDSLPLLWLGAALAQRDSSHRFVVAHLNHGLRREAGDEAQLVQRHAEMADLPCLIREIDCSGPGNRAAIARRRREKAFLEIARESGAATVVTAHHAEDQFETVIAALARGAGPRGWRGIHRQRRLDDRVVLARPFLDLPRAALRDLGRSLGLEPAVDPTNEDPRRLRGRLRRGVCAELEAIFPGASRRVAAAAEHAGLAEQALDRWLDEVWGPGTVGTWSRGDLRELPALLVAAGLRRSLLAIAPALSDRVTEAMCRRVAEAVGDEDRSPRRWAWPAGIEIELTSDRLSVRPPPRSAPVSGDRTTNPDTTPPPPDASPRT